MKIAARAESLLERIAVFLNLVPLPLVDTQVAFNSARAIMAAAALGVFEATGTSSKTADEIATACKTHIGATCHLLDCLVGLGYLNWNEGKYSLKPRMQKWLLRSSKSSITDKLVFQITEWNWMNRLEDFVRTGKPVDIHGTMTATEWTQYQNAMRDLSVNTAEELAKKIKLAGNAIKMLDIGGSHGLYSIELCKKNPHLSSIILELPGAIEQAQKIAASHNLGARIIYKSGNALTEDLGQQQYDLVMINNVVHHFSEAENKALAIKVAAALKPGGIFAIGEFIRADNPGEGGVVAASTGLYFALTSSSGTWSIQEIEGWQKKAGLHAQRKINLMSLPGWAVVVARKV
jgi:2-polyprenyl-3-methyl-5-hydroxy-6-metoxy-1,4-benzoquinol methylase